jgi:hypothetical protein
LAASAGLAPTIICSASNWILQTVFAIGGAWLAHYLVRQAMNRPSSSPKQ